MVSRWAANSGVVWTRFSDSDDAVAFNTLSGDVHLFSASADQLWRSVSEGSPKTAQELIAGLAAHLGRPADAALVDATEQTLEFMDRTGLIRPVA